MEDDQIVRLFCQRDEASIAETEDKYGSFCLGIATRLLSDSEDARECVNEALYQAWSRIPPQRPEKLGPWLGRVVRNTAVSLWRRNHRQKRYNGLDLALSELEDCIPSQEDPQQEMEGVELGRTINRWLASLKKEDRVLFVRRYWHGVSLAGLAKEAGVPPEKLAQKMYRLRQRLKTFLEKEEGICEDYGQLRSV